VVNHRRHRFALLTIGWIAALSTWTAVAAQELDVVQLREQVLALLNEERKTDGLPPLKRVETLESAAQAYSDLMMRATAGGPVYLAHIGPDGSTLAGRITSAGYNWYSLGETLGAGQKSAEQVMGDWLGSPLHRANLLSPDYRDIGIGIAVGPGTWSDGHLDPSVLWWTVDLGVGPYSDRDTNPDPTPALPVSPPPSITGYATIAGAPVAGAQFGSLLQITGQNLGFGGNVSFHGRPTGAVTWTPTSVMVFVPLQPSYPDVGPVTIMVGGQTAVGPTFTTLLPGSLPLVLPVAPTPGRPGAGNGQDGDSSGGAPAPMITDLCNTNRQKVTAGSPGVLFSVRGRGFGTNSTRKGRVVYIGPGGQFDGAIWSWSDDTITVFAPFFRGAYNLVVQVDADGRRQESNRMPVTVR